MNIEKKENYTLLSSEENSFSDMFSEFKSAIVDLEKEHIILHISDSINIATKDFSLFLDIAVTKKANKTSFVIVNATINIDYLSEEINVTPTLQEAEDILEMEAIERELGY